MTEDVVIELIEWGGDIAHVYHKDGHVYVYPTQDYPNIVEISQRLESSGAEVIDSTVEGRYTVYSQTEYEEGY